MKRLATVLLAFGAASFVPNPALADGELTPAYAFRAYGAAPVVSYQVTQETVYRSVPYRRDFGSEGAVYAGGPYTIRYTPAFELLDPPPRTSLRVRRAYITRVVERRYVVRGYALPGYAVPAAAPTGFGWPAEVKPARFSRAAGMPWRECCRAR